MDPAATDNPSLSPFTVSLPTFLAQTPHLGGIAVGAFIFATDKDGGLRILVLRRSLTERTFPSCWEVPGGGVEPPPADATILHGLVREVLEETGLRVTRIVREIVPCCEFATSRELQCRKHHFEVEVEGGNVVVDPVEHAEWKWVGVGEVDALEITTVAMKRSILEALGRKGKELEAAKEIGVE